MKRMFGILGVLLLVTFVPAALAQSDPLECPVFANAAPDVRTGYYMGEGMGYLQAGQLVRAIDSFSCVIQQIDSGYVPAYLSRE